MQSIATYITDHGFTLVDVTGRPTTWGHWDPATLNGNRTWSDERGVNSLQMLSFLAETFAATPGGDTRLSSAYAALCNATNQYGANLVRHMAAQRCVGERWLASYLRMTCRLVPPPPGFPS